MRRKISAAIGLLGFIFFAGCASAPLVIEPTNEELAAAQKFKKTMAVADFTDDGSTVSGIKAVALAKLEALLAGHFSLLEREKAEYLVTGNVTASLRGPEVKAYQTKKDGHFSGSLQDEFCAKAQVSLKIVETATGIVVYAGSADKDACRQFNFQYFTEEGSFQEVLASRRAKERLSAVAENFGNLQKDYASLVSEVTERAISGFKAPLRSKFYHCGEILRVNSATEVVVNLGSAYGIRPGDKLIVWDEGLAVADPKTGITTTPKQRRALLCVINVPSGLSAIARGSKKEVARLHPGDKVYTYE
jgi:hypothetical protein